ncbi:hypothetical protein SALBM217S_00473 [Streptomyces griseoloalbus]
MKSWPFCAAWGCRGGRDIDDPLHVIGSVRSTPGQARARGTSSVRQRPAKRGALLRPGGPVPPLRACRPLLRALDCIRWVMERARSHMPEDLLHRALLFAVQGVERDQASGSGTAHWTAVSCCRALSRSIGCFSACSASAGSVRRPARLACGGGPTGPLAYLFLERQHARPVDLEDDAVGRQVQAEGAGVQPRPQQDHLAGARSGSTGGRSRRAPSSSGRSSGRTSPTAGCRPRPQPPRCAPASACRRGPPARSARRRRPGPGCRGGGSRRPVTRRPGGQSGPLPRPRLPRPCAEVSCLPCCLRRREWELRDVVGRGGWVSGGRASAIGHRLVRSGSRTGLTARPASQSRSASLMSDRG